MKYTKRQIQEAIRHWEKVLVQMNESKNKLLDICSSKFDEDVIFSKEKKFKLTHNKYFDTLCRKTAENIEMLKETDEMKQTLNTPFNREIVNKYKNQNGIWISDDGTQFSFSFGIPMPN